MSYKLWVRWIPRVESISECAARFARMLEGLADTHPAFACWFRQANTRAAAYKPFCKMPPSLLELEAILKRGRHFTSGSKELAPDLGYSVAAWNGLNEPEALSFHLDASVSYASWLYPNKVFIPALNEENVALVNATMLKRTIKVIAECWNADWGVVETWDYEGRSTDAQGYLLFPYGGWLTYLAPALAEKVTPPPEVVAERLPNGVLFMLATEEQFDVANPVHVARLDAIQKALAPVQRSVASAAGVKSRPAASI